MKLWFLLVGCIIASTTIVTSQTNVTIDLTKSTKEISPLIYGTNQPERTKNGAEKWGMQRMGGNRMTGYNWENNASNAGSDYQHYSDNFVTWYQGITSNENDPGYGVTYFHDKGVSNGWGYTLATLQMAGYVSADKSGIVSTSEVAPSSRWKTVKAAKGSAFTTTPSTTDDNVYMDEQVNFYVNKYGKANNNGAIKAYSLDNEPVLWNHTHSRLHPNTVTCTELLEKSIALSKSVKAVDEYAEIYGPALYGMGAFTTLGDADASGWNDVKSGYDWFIDYYLDKMENASSTAGKRLLDVLDIHYYPEATDGSTRILMGGDNIVTTAMRNARMQAPRTLWDANYIEDSWIGQWCKDYIPIIPKVKESINAYYPGTKIGITEYDFGGIDDISGGIAIADVLGIFGKYGVYQASLWNGGNSANSEDYITSAYRIYRNYDGNGSEFGNQYVVTTNSDSVNASAYSAINNSDNDRVNVILINKKLDNSQTMNVTLNSSISYIKAIAYSFDINSKTITTKDITSSLSSNKVTYSAPKASVTNIEFTSDNTSAVEEKVAISFGLQSYPNPFNPVTTISYSLPTNEIGTLNIYNIKGEIISSHKALTESGSVMFGNKNIASGVYFAKLITTQHSRIIKMVMIK